ncbi:MAG: hypothetical protein IJN44_08340 [Clostridia bacterium]|nr:hypothetical protein [Clostridia bacterium]
MRKHRSLVLVLMMIVLCATIIVGSTMAYYTDEVPAGENLVTSGDLEVKFEWADKLGEGWQDAASAGPIFNQTHWEPNFTTVKYIRVSNTGDMPFQYELNVVPTLVPENGVNLMDVIDVYFGVVDENTPAITAANYADELQKVGNLTALLKNENGAGYGIVLPKDAKGTLPQGAIAYNESVTVCIALHMQHTAGNEYMNRSVGEGFNVQLAATQYTYDDAFGTLFSGGAQLPEVEYATSKTVSVTPDENGLVPYDIVFESDTGVIAVVPKGARMEQGANQLILIVYPKAKSDANLTLSENEQVKAWEVEVEGLADDNTVPVRFTLPEAMQKGLNIGNYSLYHVENGTSVPMTRVEEITASSAHNSFSYNPATGDMGLALATFSEVAIVSDTTKAWEGNFDYSWYTNAVVPVAEGEADYIIANADQLAAFGAIVGGMDGQTQDSFSGKTVKLIADINLGYDEENKDEEGNSKNIIFYPIGYYNSEKSYEKVSGGSVTSSVSSFEGTFDGNGHTVKNFYQNTWEMFGDYNDGYSDTPNHYKDAMGLFGYVVNGTIKNLTVDHFSSDGEFTPTGVIAAYAVNSTFENIAITNCNPRVYNTGNGGIVGIGGNSDDPDTYKLTFNNITIDNTNKISALWGSWDVACGGLVGMFRGAGHVYMTNCHVAAQMDVNNDVCGNYQYYWYRYSGMMVGTNKNMTTDANGYTVPETEKFHAEGCTVHFGDWNDYYYCELVANSLASYTHDHQFSRLTEISSLDEIKSGDTWTKAGNFLLISDDTKTCYHIVNKDGTLTQHLHTDAGKETVAGMSGILKEDKQIIYLPFNQLFTGYGWGVKHIPIYDDGTPNPFVGVTIHERKIAKSVEKFTANGNVLKLKKDTSYTLDVLFSAIEEAEVPINDSSVTVGITNHSEENPVTATFDGTPTNWQEKTITFTSNGTIDIIIQDYQFCIPTKLTVDIADAEEIKKIEKFEVAFDHDTITDGNQNYTEKYMYRVGNANPVSMSSLFEAKLDATIGTVEVTVETIDGNASGTYTSNATDWTKGTIQFSGTGVVKVTITDNVYCIPTELTLEVVDAVNATTAASATKNNVVLLNDCGFGSLEVSGGYTLYGNGFTMTCGSDSAALDMGYAFVTLNNGILDNVQIDCPNFDYAVLYKSNMTESGNRSETTDRTRYFNVKSGVMVSGNSQILNSRISGGRAAVNVTGGNVVIDNSRIELGAVASLLVGSANSLTLRDVTLVQKPTASTYDSNKTLMGFSVLFVCDANGDAAPVTLEGTLVQNAWVDENDKQYVPSAGQSIISTVLGKTEYLHDLDGNGTKESLNLGFAYMPESLTSKVNTTTITDNRTNKDTVPYDYAEVSILNGKTYVYSYKNTHGTEDSFKTESEYKPNKYGDIITVNYSDTADGLITGKSFGTDGWVYELNVDLDKLSGYALDFSKLSMSVNGVTVTDFKVNGNDKPTSPVAVTAGGTTYTLTATIDDKEYTATYKVTGTETSKESPSKISGPTAEGFGVAKSYGGDWSGAADVLTGVKVKYWSVAENKYVEFDFSQFTVPGNAGKLNGTNNYWEYTHTNNDFTLKVTNTVAIHSGKSVYGMPIRGTDGKLYFTISSTNGYVGSGTTSRAITMQYEFTDNNGGEKLTFTHTFNISYSKNGQYSYSDLSGSGKLTELTDNSGGGITECVTPDTLVTLADGTQVRVDSLTGDEKLLVWNMETGKLDEAGILFVDHDPEAEFEIVHLYFSDGTDVKVIYEHGFWDYDLNRYVYLDKDGAKYIGHSFFKLNGNGGEKVQLTDVVIEKEMTTAWSPVTENHLCYFVNGMLSMPGGVGGLFNIFDVDADTMMYDMEALAKDIETYGLFTYEELNAIVELPEEMFNAAGGAYLKISIGKGNLSMDELIYMINRYKPFF